MALSTTSSSTPASSRVNVDGGDFCALVCAASAGVHGNLVVPHAGESTPMTIASLGQALIPTPLVSATVTALLLTLATAYLLPRTSGVRGLTEHPEPFDTVGTAISWLEVAAAVVAVRQPNPRRHR